MTIDHMVREKGALVQINCKGCGVAIQSLNTLSVTSRKAPDGRIVTERVALLPNHLYTELTLICLDDFEVITKHQTHLCQACAALYRDNLERLTDFMRADIQYQIDNEGGSPHHNRWLWRKVIGVK